MPKVVFGFISGFVSAPMGIGGAVMNVPILKYFGYPINKAIGSAAAIGFFIALFGAIGFLISITGTTTMIIGGNIIDNVNTPYSIGYINLLGFFVFVPVTMVMARIGARVVYKIDKKLLSRIFGCFLLVVSARSFFEYFSIT